MTHPSIPAPTEALRLPMSDGVALSVRRHARPGADRLVITHGNGFAVDGYRAFWEPLLADYEVVVFDMRNHGQSDANGADGHNYLQMSRDLASVRDFVAAEWGARRTAGVFHSMSSRAGMKQAVEGGFGWDAMILFDPPNVPLRGHALYDKMHRFETRLVEYALNRPDRFASVEAMVEGYAAAPGSRTWLPGSMVDMANAVLRPAPEGGFALVCQRELEASIYLAALTLNLWPTAAQIGGPTCMICADPEMEKGSPTAIPNRTLCAEGAIAYRSIAGTGHLLQIERPDACREAMRDFLVTQGFRA
jgi:pimeloyl-ACP methyl ester carboxylesterase